MARRGDAKWSRKSDQAEALSCRELLRLQREGESHHLQHKTEGQHTTNPCSNDTHAHAQQGLQEHTKEKSSAQ